ncbi:hypothetical protein KC19_7G129400 [Ceratodon purpureus]|uniref:Uncharacterized protein n=1 Tax=Ceratodon purpureus TaxID=3225 RepID=A0A8T0H5V4_CERPU|nr:hypothetical protein KC19_7G129400 [Ceratodon purpureus]
MLCGIFLLLMVVLLQWGLGIFVFGGEGVVGRWFFMGLEWGSEVLFGDFVWLTVLLCCDMNTCSGIGLELGACGVGVEVQWLISLFPLLTENLGFMRFAIACYILLFTIGP